MWLLLCAELTMSAVVQLHKGPTSLEAPVGKDGDCTMADLIPDETEDTAEDAATLGLMTKDMENLLYTLSEREGDVLRLRYGLDDGREKTLEEVGRILLVSFLQIFCMWLDGVHGAIACIAVLRYKADHFTVRLWLFMPIFHAFWSPILSPVFFSDSHSVCLH